MFCGTLSLSHVVAAWSALLKGLRGKVSYWPSLKGLRRLCYFPSLVKIRASIYTIASPAEHEHGFMNDGFSMHGQPTTHKALELEGVQQFGTRVPP